MKTLLRLVSVFILIALAQAAHAAGKTPFYVLAVSWQPAFCEFHRKKSECVSQTEKRFDASHFALHGLWPQPRRRAYCGVKRGIIKLDKRRRWNKLPGPELTRETRLKLYTVMPGTRSSLHRHEYYKHGTCYEDGDAQEYFADSLRLMEQLNKSQVRRLFAGTIGHALTGAEIRDAFDRTFGEGAGRRVRIACRDDGNRRLITELTIGLYGHIGPKTKMRDLIQAARPTDPGCPSGIVDPAGLQ